MRRGISFAVIALSLAPAAAGAERTTATKEPAVPQLMQSCDAHKFETVVRAKVDGQLLDKKVKLCGVEGQSDAEWIKTLKDAIAKLQANKAVEPAVRDQIVGAINREVARLSIEGSAPTPLRRDPGSGTDLSQSRDYSTLPPLPPPRETAEAPVVPPASLPPPQVADESRVRREYAQLPPLPTAPAPAPVARPAPIPAVAPRLTFGCDAPGEIASDAPCADFERETMLTIHARDDVPAGTLLQFVRNGQSQAELPLNGLRKGGALRTALPRQVCRGFTNGRLELRLVRGEAGSEVLTTEGPYNLRC